MDEQQKLSLTNIRGGGAIEMFDIALEKVLANIKDINTSLAKRAITLTVVFQPSENRDYMDIGIQCKPTLVFQDPIRTTANINLDSRGRPVAMERVSKQVPMFANVTNLKTEESHD